MSRERITENPFYVLGLRPECSRADLEREGQKLLALLELSVASAKTYKTPLGPMPRTADRVRQALAELRDPQKRLVHELWAQLPATEPEPPAATLSAAPDAGDPEDGAADAVPGPWPDALEALGFGARR
ncbi:MAG: hypothetical protein U1A78_01980 [Polyangia bacterium]